MTGGKVNRSMHKYGFCTIHTQSVVFTVMKWMLSSFYSRFNQLYQTFIIRKEHILQSIKLITDYIMIVFAIEFFLVDSHFFSKEHCFSFRPGQLHLFDSRRIMFINRCIWVRIYTHDFIFVKIAHINPTIWMKYVKNTYELHRTEIKLVSFLIVCFSFSHPGLFSFNNKFSVFCDFKNTLFCHGIFVKTMCSIWAAHIPIFIHRNYANLQELFSVYFIQPITIKLERPIKLTLALQIKLPIRQHFRPLAMHLVNNKKATFEGNYCKVSWNHCFLYGSF